MDLHYKIDADADHMAKFCGYRPTELGGPVFEFEKLEIWGRVQLEAARRPSPTVNTIFGVVGRIKI